MTLYQDDILTRAERSGRDVLWVSERILVDLIQTLSEYYLRTKSRNRYRKSVPPAKRTQRILPDTGASWRWAKIDGRFYYDYDRIPDNSRANYRSRLPGKQELIEMYKNSLTESRQDEIERRIKEAITKGYKDYLHCYRGYKYAYQVSLSKACAVLEVSVLYIQEKEVSVKKSTFFRDLSEIVKRNEVPYLPKNYRRLKEKIVMVLNGTAIADLVDIPRRGNSNARQYEDVDILSWIYQMRSMPKNFTNIYIIRQVRKMCVIAGKYPPSESWFNELLARHNTKFLTAAGRYGEKGRKGQIYGAYLPIEGALFAGDCWQADGTRINMIGHKGKEGKQEFLFITAIRDVHSGDVLGFHLDTKEDRWAYFNAMKMAVAFTGHLPYEVVFDRFPGHNTPEWKGVKSRMEKAGTKVTTTHLATGKAVLERFFGTLQTVFMQDSDYYYGEGIMSTRNHAHRTSKYLYDMQKKAKREGWDFDAAWKEAAELIEKYTNTPLSEYSRKSRTVDKSPRELWAESDKPNVINLDAFQQIEIFGLEKKISIRSGMIKTEIQRIEYFYKVDEYDTVANYKTVLMRYDMEDLGQVHLFTDDEVEDYLGTATEQRAIKLYGPDTDVKRLGVEKARIKAIQERKKRDLQALVADGAELDTLTAATNPKTDTASAETAWLMDRTGEWKDDGKPKLLVVVNEEETEDDFELDVRDQY